MARRPVARRRRLGNGGASESARRLLIVELIVQLIPGLIRAYLRSHTVYRKCLEMKIYRKLYTRGVGCRRHPGTCARPRRGQVAAGSIRGEPPPGRGSRSFLDEIKAFFSSPGFRNQVSASGPSGFCLSFSRRLCSGRRLGGGGLATAALRSQLGVWNYN